MRKLGKMGEDSFSLFCSAAGLVVNRVQVDETGWDFLVEFDPSPQNLPLDMQEGPLQAKVQVKATDTRIDGVQISLSNLQRLAKDPLPAFICLMVFYGKDEVQEIFILHIDKAFVSKILKSVRKQEAKGCVELHKRSLLVKFPPNTRIKSLSGFNLAEAITGYVGKSISKYTETKLQELKDIGYENGRYIIRCSFDPEPLKKLTEAFLGHDVTVDVSEISHYTNRFGIELPETDHKRGKATLRISPKPYEQVLVKFSDSIFSNSYAFVCKMYVASLNDIHVTKVRVVNDFFEFTIDFKGNKLDLKITTDEDTEATVSDFVKWFKVVRTMVIQDIYLTIEPPGMASMGFTMQTKNVFNSINNEYEICKSLTRIITELDLPIEHKYKLHEILMYENYISQLEHVLMSKNGDYSLEFSRDGETKHNDISLGKKTAGLIFLRFKLPKHFVSLILVVSGILDKIDDNLYNIKGNQGVIKHRWVSETAFTEKDEVQRIIKVIANEYEAEGVEVFIPDVLGS
jgi:hypothetical protein